MRQPDQITAARAAGAETPRVSRYRVRRAAGPDDLHAAQRLRHRAFRGREGIDADAFDALCQHVLVEDCASGRLLCCYRVLPLRSAAEVTTSYSAQFYDLSALARLEGPMAEMGRFCLDPGARDPDILRLALAEMARLVSERGVGFLFGCSSFPGADPARHAAALAVLRAGHLAPRRWRPLVKAQEVVRFAEGGEAGAADPREGLKAMPPLLRSYLALGGRVSDHAVIDRDLDTLHVFTGVEVAAIPAPRKRLLQAAH